MTTLAKDAIRILEVGDLQSYPMIAANIIYEGAAVGQVSASGNVRPLTSADRFSGFAERTVDNLSGAAGGKRVRAYRRGLIQLPVTGAVTTDPLGTPIYATDDNTFSFSPVGGVFVGVLTRWVSAGMAMMEFDVDKLIDPWAGLLAVLVSGPVTTTIQDTGKVMCVDTTAVITLAATAAGGATSFLNIGPFGTVQMSLAPVAVDRVQGPNLPGTDNKAMVNTLATAKRGDYATLVWGEADGPYVTRMRGTWVTAP